MNIYAESSAVAAWLLREPQETDVYAILVAATHVVSSDLTLVECDRAIQRGAAIRRISPAAAKSASSDLTATAAKWDVVNLLPAIVERARRPFPFEPIRTLDALHVAWALHARAAIPDLAILSLDDRIRRVAQSVGIAVLPR
jgi:predicted nucleic acid-binding protein